MSAYYVYSIDADVAEDHVTEWTDVDVFAGYAYDEDWGEEKAQYIRCKCPVVNGWVFEWKPFENDKPCYVAYGKKSDYTDHFKDVDFVKSDFVC